ncbi:MAG: sigma 54-interacting transcriptional regulator [Thermodesulfobacteriota bacterium]
MSFTFTNARLTNKSKHQDYEAVWKYLYSALSKLPDSGKSRETDAVLVSTSLELANVSFILGKGFSDLIVFLKNARLAAERMGDRRSCAMINLHLGRLYYFGEQRQLAMESFEVGKKEVEEIGDDDLVVQASEFIGLYYFIQGIFAEALGYFEQSTESFEETNQGMTANPSGPMWLSYSAAFLGQHHRAIGTLDYYRRHAVERGERSLATTLRAVLGIILMGVRKTKEAVFHLSGSLQEALQDRNALATYFAKGGLALHHMVEGRVEESRKWLAETMQEGAASGIIRQYASPFALELLHAYNRHGLPLIAELNYHREIPRVLQEANIHLRGVALRLRAVDAVEEARDDNKVALDLEQSEAYLRRSGDPIQLAKTRLEIVRLHLRRKDQDAARLTAHKAWKGVSGYGSIFYPDDLRHLLTVKDGNKPVHHMSEDLINMFTDMIKTLVPSADMDELLTRTVKATNRFFGAERGGIFWFGSAGNHKTPLLRASCHLSEADVSQENFQSKLSVVFKAFRENKPQVIRLGMSPIAPGHSRAILCIPFEINGQPYGVLYHDNSYLEDCFDNFDGFQLTQLADSLTLYISQIRNFSADMEKKAAGHLRYFEEPGAMKMVARSPAMQKVLGEAKQIATTDSTVLILGETGVGKELLARQIHAWSRRSEQPMVTVDPTTIPETLIESELFGHEKGAFTGADRQKQGLIELAHRGTLFIDEIGEIPMSIQVKLLRVLQERTIVRVGGTRTLKSDFRLVAATNRDLAAEVAQGNFREDLYYRLNVIPMEIPPLRDRRGDVLLMARHFLLRYTGRHNKIISGFSQKNEEQLSAYDWPGNVREMKNVIERTVLLSMDGELELDLSPLRKSVAKDQFADLPSFDEVQRRYIRYILDRTNGKIGGADGAASIMEMNRCTLYNRMKKLGLR